MDHLWSPWRYRYLSHPRSREGCIFCEMAAESNDRENLIVYRGAHNFVVLNRYPYTSGHLMVVPFAHAAQLNEIDPQVATELIGITRMAESCIRNIYRPHGLNLGMNIGESAGAGIAGHIHMHVLPRWSGDSNFMTTIAETRVLPEELDVTWARLHEAFSAAARGE